ncbi:pilus assembly protein N-terminal domain-containing protein [Chlorobium sp. N1]|uniref:type II and III secretion system protein family protein n=1 Tax=Chlorobium sp. N1 TaxID=2491138 RepID=UPI00103F5462|nr:pilus assembly protein N-terminal domain-containing protein [Chlorobium sp. N1]TCD47227.1 type II and III secretion system protein family protein [Chlorobium sp. N1]
MKKCPAPPERARRRTAALLAFALFLPAASAAAPALYRVPAGESRVYRLDRPVERVAVGDPDIADFIMLRPSELYLLGKKSGSTNLILWETGGRVSTRPLEVSRNVAPLRRLLRTVLPEERDIKVVTSGPTIVVSGSVSDALAAETVRRIVRTWLGGRAPDPSPEASLTRSDAAGTDPAAAATTGSGATEPQAMKGVVNLLRIRNPQQVRLEVRIAEVSKSHIESLGLSWAQNHGGTRGSIMTGFVSSATVDMLFNATATSTGAVGNELRLDAEKKEGAIKILAEPTIVAMSGEEGYFLVGGKVYTPTATGTGAVDYVERSYGVGLRFTPKVLEGGRIWLKVAPEVSEPLQEAVTAGTTSTLPSFKTSYASTTVQMKEGENLVIGGLLRDNLTEIKRSLPLLGQIPLLGALFRHTETSSETTELLVVVRPTLVAASGEKPELPTDRFTAPTANELLLEGKLEGTREKE